MMQDNDIEINNEIGKVIVEPSKQKHVHEVTFNKNGTTNIKQSTLVPSELLHLKEPTNDAKSNHHLFAENNSFLPRDLFLKYDSSKCGKWIISPIKEGDINNKWNKVKLAVERGALWQAKVYRVKDSDDYEINIYTPDIGDKAEIASIYNALIDNKIVDSKTDIEYKTSGEGKNNRSLYNSKQIKKWEEQRSADKISIMQTPAVGLTSGACMEKFTSLALENCCTVQMGSTYRTNADNTVSNNSSKKENADVFASEVTKNGLPISVILDGCGLDASNDDIQAFSKLILKKLTQLSQYLNGKKLEDWEIRRKIVTIYEELDKSAQHKYTSTASFSASIVFRNKNGELSLVCFGTGDTMILQDDGQEVKTIIAAQNVNGVQPLAFPIPPNHPNDEISKAPINLKTVTDNLAIFVGKATPGDRLFHVTDGFYENLPCEEEEFKQSLHSLSITRTRLKPNALEPGFDMDKLTNEVVNNSLKSYEGKNKQTTGQVISEGDDCTIGAIKIYEQSIEDKCKQTFTLIQRLQCYINEKRHEKSFWLDTVKVIKISAAEKLIKFLQGVEDVIFNAKEKLALNSGSLAKVRKGEKIYVEEVDLGNLPEQEEDITRLNF